RREALRGIPSVASADRAPDEATRRRVEDLDDRAGEGRLAIAQEGSARDRASVWRDEDVDTAGDPDRRDGDGSSGKQWALAAVPRGWVTCRLNVKHFDLVGPGPEALRSPRASRIGRHHRHTIPRRGIVDGGDGRHDRLEGTLIPHGARQCSAGGV